MSDCKLSLLTHLHIGSGRDLSGGAEHIYFPTDKKIAVVDESKVLQLIGKDQIPIWIDHIEKASSLNFLEYLKRRKQDLHPEDIARRILNYEGRQSVLPQNSLKEFIHNGFGQPYIPGSSIKGAIRTAFFGSYMLEHYKRDSVPDQILFSRNGRFKDSQLSQKIFGPDPNHDWMRFLQVSDFHTEAGTSAVFSETLNERWGMQFSMKDEVRQLIEVLPKGVEARGTIRINETLMKQLENRRDDSAMVRRAAIKDMSGLFSTLNAHTRRLVDDEIRAFIEVNADLPDGAENLVESLTDIRNKIDRLPEDAAIIRMSFGSGFRFMTGHWVNELFSDQQWGQLSESVRRDRNGRYSEFPLPKSRKVVLGGNVLGFVQLQLA